MNSNQMNTTKFSHMTDEWIDGGNYCAQDIINLRDSNTAALARLEEIAAEERSCCPEHVGFKEYIGNLKARVQKLEDALTNIVNHPPESYCHFADPIDDVISQLSDVKNIAKEALTP